MNKQAIAAWRQVRLRKRLATLTPEARAERPRMLTKRVEMDQRELAILRTLETRNPKPKDAP